MTGYAHPLYAESLSEFGAPYRLPRCGGSILVRRIADSPHRDAMGCYPLFSCSDWAQLQYDLEDSGNDLVSLALVTDPFGHFDLDELRRCFPDRAIPFKEHLVVDLEVPLPKIASKHHRYYARKALRELRVERCHDPPPHLDEWVALYETLITRHGIRGVQAFSRQSFTQQLEVPGLVMFRAIHQGKTVGAHLWYEQGSVAVSHLAAFSPLGYDLMASYALYWSGIEHFAGTLKWLNLGAGAGVVGDQEDGLSRFKRGWATGARTAYFCGRVFDREVYDRLVQARGLSPGTAYFPAYRHGEFA